MLQIMLLVIALCVDAFAASLAYGANNIKIPFKCALLIAFTGAIFLSISFFISQLIQLFFPLEICIIIGATILLLVGISSLFQNTIKSWLRKKNNSQCIKFKYANMAFVLDIFLDETKADIDNSKTLSVKEAVYLAIALSMDSLVTGLGSGFAITYHLQIILFSFVICVCSILVGCFLGRKISIASNIDISWLSGLILILLAFMKIL